MSQSHVHKARRTRYEVHVRLPEIKQPMAHRVISHAVKRRYCYSSSLPLAPHPAAANTALSTQIVCCCIYACALFVERFDQRLRQSEPDGASVNGGSYYGRAFSRLDSTPDRRHVRGSRGSPNWNGIGGVGLSDGNIASDGYFKAPWISGGGGGGGGSLARDSSYGSAYDSPYDGSIYGSAYGRSGYGDSEAGERSDREPLFRSAGSNVGSSSGDSEFYDPEYNGASAAGLSQGLDPSDLSLSMEACRWALEAAEVGTAAAATTAATGVVAGEGAVDGGEVHAELAVPPQLGGEETGSGEQGYLMTPSPASDISAGAADLENRAEEQDVESGEGRSDDDDEDGGDDDSAEFQDARDPVSEVID